MFKYQVTNTSAKRGANHARPIFLTEAGKLLQPGDSAPINRLNKGTSDLIELGDLHMDTGSFSLPPPAPKKPVSKDDDDDEADSSPKAAVETGPAGFVTISGKKRSNKVIPLVAAGAEDEPAKDDAPVSSASTDDDEDLGIPTVTKKDVASASSPIPDATPAVTTPTPAAGAATTAFHDNTIKKPAR